MFELLLNNGVSCEGITILIESYARHYTFFLIRTLKINRKIEYRKHIINLKIQRMKTRVDQPPKKKPLTSTDHVHKMRMLARAGKHPNKNISISTDCSHKMRNMACTGKPPKKIHATSTERKIR